MKQSLTFKGVEAGEPDQHDFHTMYEVQGGKKDAYGSVEEGTMDKSFRG